MEGNGMAREELRTSEEDEDMIFAEAREFLQLVGRTDSLNDDGKNLESNNELTCTFVDSQANFSREKYLRKRVSEFPGNRLMQVVAIMLWLVKLKWIEKLGIEEYMNCLTSSAKKKRAKMAQNRETITPHKRRKLERIKAPIKSFVKTIKQAEVTNDEDESVNKMLNHMKKLPEQTVYSPLSIPMAFLRKQGEERESSVSSSGIESLEYIYLSSEKDLATWKILNSSLTNRNVFVGNLSYKVDELVLKSVFETIVENGQQQLVKARLVTESLSGVSKGYGFVEFPYRRAAELAFICLQRFELYGREMQLRWGQENICEKTQDCFENQGKKGTIISDSQHAMSKDQRTRWDSEEKFSSQDKQSKSIHKEQSSGNNKDNSSILIKNVLNCEENKRQSIRPLCSWYNSREHEKESIGEVSTIHKRTAIQWMTKQQRASLIKAVCGNLRKKSVTGHLGVFGTYFETDNNVSSCAS